MVFSMRAPGAYTLFRGGLDRRALASRIRFEKRHASHHENYECTPSNPRVHIHCHVEYDRYGFHRAFGMHGEARRGQDSRHYRRAAFIFRGILSFGLRGGAILRSICVPEQDQAMV